MGAPLPIPPAPSPPSPPSLCLVSKLTDDQREAIRAIVSEMLIAAAWEPEDPRVGEDHG